MPRKISNSFIPGAGNSHMRECWLDCLVCPRRYRANLPSRLRPSLFGSD
jgi:hypothetical protein